MESNKQYEKYIKLLEANKNLILTGAPGTGKTYLAKEIAKAMNAEYEFVQFHPSYDYTDFVEGLRPTPPAGNGHIGFERKNGVFKEFCKEANRNIDNKRTTLANVQNLNGITKKVREISLEDVKKYIIPGEEIPSSTVRTKYIIEKLEGSKVFINGPSIDPKRIPMHEIVEAYKNRLWEGGQKNGYDSYTAALAKSIYKKLEKENAEQKSNNIRESNNKKYIFIIDEINRGEISKIFGELFFSIDPGYRGKNGLVKTQYQNLITDEADPFYDGFYVPENVYIIGTMNDIDRSVESMDFAMRRRFAWAEVKASENVAMLDDLGGIREDVIEVMNRLNAAIWNNATGTGIDGLNEAYHIGGSYFSKIRLYLNEDKSNKKEAYGQLWNNHLKGVLFEYLRGMSDAMENLKKLEQVYYNDRANDDIEG